MVPSKRRPRANRRSIRKAKQSISVHQNLSDALTSFLKNEKLHGNQTKEALTTLVSLLSNYREEGLRLFPEVFIFDDVSKILKALPNSERVVIGSGPKVSETVGIAVKRCAPLAQWGWSLYILRTAAGFEYGLLRCGLTTLSLTASELIIEQGDKSLPALLVRHISHHTVEISGACQNSIRIHFGATEQSGEDPLLAARKFCESTVLTVPSALKEQVRNFYWRLLAGVLRGGHGCLAVVLKPKTKALPPQLRDGVIIAPPIDISAKVDSLLKANSCESDTKLRAMAALIRGMLYTDGVTVFQTDGSVRAYNVFVTGPKHLSGGAAPFGGARRRAFAALSSWVGKCLRSAFFLSQDGHAEFRGSYK